MSATKPVNYEAVGPRFSLPAMLESRTQAMNTVQRIAQGIRPGMSEGAACAHAERTILQMGAEKLWHRTIARFGEATLKTFYQSSDAARTLAENDIFFVDIGPVWNGHEGDAGDTFAVGGAGNEVAQGVADIRVQLGQYLVLRGDRELVLARIPGNQFLEVLHYGGGRRHRLSARDGDVRGDLEDIPGEALLHAVDRHLTRHGEDLQDRCQ
jgi:hypothetical protein